MIRFRTGYIAPANCIEMRIKYAFVCSLFVCFIFLFFLFCFFRFLFIDFSAESNRIQNEKMNWKKSIEIRNDVNAISSCCCRTTRLFFSVFSFAGIRCRVSRFWWWWWIEKKTVLAGSYFFVYVIHFMAAIARILVLIVFGDDSLSLSNEMLYVSLRRCKNWISLVFAIVLFPECTLTLNIDSIFVGISILTL